MEPKHMSLVTLRIKLVLVGLLLSHSALAQTANTQLSEIVDKIKPRAEVLNTAPDLVLQVVLPPQYAQCLYASFAEAKQENNVAHRYLLEQIDFLVGAGLSTGSIQALIAYGHAVTNMAFAAEVGKSIDKIEGNDFKLRQQYIYRTFTRLACVNTFSDQRVLPALREIIQRARSQG